MTTNYEQIPIAIDNCIAAAKELEEKQRDLSEANADIAQHQLAVDTFTSKLDALTSTQAGGTEDLATATAEVTAHETRRAALRTSKDTLETEIGVLNEDATGIKLDHDAAELHRTGTMDPAEDAVVTAVGEHGDLINDPATGLIFLRGALAALVEELAAKKVELAALVAAGGDTVAVQTEIDLLVGTTIPAAELAISNQQALIDAKETEITGLRATVNGHMDTLRTLEKTRDDRIVELRAKLDELRLVDDELQNIEGSSAPAVPLDAGHWFPWEQQISHPIIATTVTTGYSDLFDMPTAGAGPTVAAADPHEDSALAQALRVKNAHTNLVANHDALVTEFGEAKTAAEAAHTTASGTPLTDATTNLGVAETDNTDKKAICDAKIATQVQLEVNAALALLEDFLKKGSVVLSAGATVDSGVEGKIALACPSAKVQKALHDVNLSYSSQADYLALQGTIITDVYKAFFHEDNDPCMAKLGKDELAAFRLAVYEGFSTKAFDLLVKYGVITVTPTPKNNHFVLLLALVLLVLVIVGVFWYQGKM